MEHSVIINKFESIVQELYNPENNISEKDIQNAFIDQFKNENHRDYSAEKEREGRYDIVIYRKGKPYIFYELKTHFKSFERIETSKIEADLQKLHDAHKKEKNANAYFIMISTYEHFNYLKEHEPEHFAANHKERKRISIKYVNHFDIQCSAKRESENFCILTWKAL